MPDNAASGSAAATSADAPTNSPIVSMYLAATAASAELASRARDALPSGIAHDGRHLTPHNIYVDRAAGPHKWDVDGNRYVDYFGGHGALILGHVHPQVHAAIEAALSKGTQFGANHPAEIKWAEAIKRLVPCAERVRFTSSGTEATLMALRVARAATGRRKVVRFLTHFHGWHDHMTSGHQSHFDGTPTAGVLPSVAEGVELVEPHDTDRVAELLANDQDIAAVILEPTGSSFGGIPADPALLTTLRELTSRHGVVLVFDEVVTGFRVSPGGAQGHFGVTPDLTSLAKIVAGGLPGGAIVGSADLLEHLDHAAAARTGREKIVHPGTFNANPVSAAAGIAALQIVGDTDVCDRANATAQALRDSLNRVCAEYGVPWSVYGTFSGFHIFTNPEDRDVDPLTFDPAAIPWRELRKAHADRSGQFGERVRKFRLAMLVNGVDLSSWPGGVVSATHTPDDVADTTAAFAKSIEMMRAEGEV